MGCKESAYRETTVAGRGGPLYARTWLAAPETRRGRVVVVHGLGEHSGRYQDLAGMLAAAGWSTLAYDQQGHGLSPGRRGCVTSYDGLLDDLLAARRTAREHLGGDVEVLLGHSMGGNIAANHVLRCEAALPSGVVLSGPLLLPRNPPSRSQLVAGRLIGNLLPFVRIRAPIEAEQLTRDPQELLALAADPLLHRRMSLYLISQLLAQGRWALDHAALLRLPILLLQGGDDPLVDPRGAATFAGRCESGATLQQYPGMLHEVWHDEGREQVIEDLLQWLGALNAR